MATKIQLRRGTAAEWAADNPTLSAGEPGYDSTNLLLKIGDGTTAWATLSGIQIDATLENLITAGAAGMSIFWDGSGWEVAQPQVGGLVADSENAGFLTMRPLIGTEVNFSGIVLPTGTLIYVSDYAEGDRMRFSGSGGTAVDESTPLLTHGSTIMPNKLHQSAATTGQVLKWNGTIWAPADDATGAGSTVTGGVVSGAYHQTKMPYGTTAQWETAVPAYVMPAGALFILDGIPRLSIDGTLGWDECSAIRLSSDEITLTSTTGDLSTTRIAHNLVAVGGTTYTIDNVTTKNCTLVFTSATAVTVTLANSIAAGSTFNWIQKGAGQITFTPGASATRTNRQSHTKSAGQWAVGTLICHENAGSAAAIVLAGDTAA